MADAINLPSQFSFEVMLSHTFPGFFAAISIFMLFDLISPLDLTAWVAKDLTALITFTGFVVIAGTIMGVILDGIHHNFIEDDIFDNFKTIREIEFPLEERLKGTCTNNYKNLTRHYFFPSLGKANEGDKATSFVDHLQNGYYRYSEFYANIFLSLILFSFIIPFYAFDVLQIGWTQSIGIGVISFLVGCISFNSSYSTYKTYLLARNSLICGFISKNQKEEAQPKICQNNCTSSTCVTKLPQGQTWFNYVADYVAFAIPITTLYVLFNFVNKNFMIDNFVYIFCALFGLFIPAVIILFIFPYIVGSIAPVQEDNKKGFDAFFNYLSKAAYGICLSALCGIFIIFLILGYSNPMTIMPGKIEVNLTNTDPLNSIMKSIEIRDNAASTYRLKISNSVDMLINPNCEKIDDSYLYTTSPNKRNIITLNFTIPQYLLGGEYNGDITFWNETSDSLLHEVPVNIRVKANDKHEEGRFYDPNLYVEPDILLINLTKSTPLNNVTKTIEIRNVGENESVHFEVSNLIKNWVTIDLMNESGSLGNKIINLSKISPTFIVANINTTKQTGIGEYRGVIDIVSIKNSSPKVLQEIPIVIQVKENSTH